MRLLEFEAKPTSEMFMVFPFLPKSWSSLSTALNGDTFSTFYPKSSVSWYSKQEGVGSICYTRRGKEEGGKS